MSAMVYAPTQLRIPIISLLWLQAKEVHLALIEK